MRIFVAIGTACAVGLHWVLLQCIAWMGMLVMYTQQENSLAEGLARNFDGAHPCALCDAIKEGRGNERERNLPSSPKGGTEIKLTQMFAAAESWRLPQFPSADSVTPPHRLGGPGMRTVSPPEKPPRIA